MLLELVTTVAFLLFLAWGYDISDIRSKTNNIMTELEKAKQQAKELQKQIEEHRATIERLEKAEKTVKKRHKGNWYLSVYEDPVDVVHYSKNTNETGRGYPTKEAAEKAEQTMRNRTRILDRIHELNQEFKKGWWPDWGEGLDDKYYIYHIDNEYKTSGCIYTQELPNEYYMATIQISDQIIEEFTKKELDSLITLI